MSPHECTRMRTSFSIPDPTVEEFDQVWQDQGLDNRSRAVREAMQEYIESHSRLEEPLQTLSRSLPSTIVITR